MELDPCNLDMLRKAANRCSELCLHNADLANVRIESNVISQTDWTRLSSIEMLRECCRLYHDRNAFGSWSAEGQAFELVTYGEWWRQVEALATGLAARGFRRGDVLAICGPVGLSTWRLDNACLYLGGVCAPLAVTEGPTNLRAMLANAEPSWLACTAEHLSALLPLLPPSQPCPRILLLPTAPPQAPSSDAPPPTDLPLAEAPLRLDEVMTDGALPTAAPVVPGSGEDPLVLLLYTSGSTGTPKGAMFHDSVARHYWNPHFRPEYHVPMILESRMPATTWNFAPFSHIGGRVMTQALMGWGGTVYFPSSPDIVSCMLKDLAAVRPTTLSLVPGLVGLLWHHYQAHEAQHGAAAADEWFREHLLGGRVLILYVSAAPSTQDALHFLRRVLQAPMFNRYGATEIGIVLNDHRLLSCVATHAKIDTSVGAPPSEKGPMMGPMPLYPRGELLVKTPCMVRGYYKNPEATAAMLDNEGYYRTGDVVEQRGPDTFYVVDRCVRVLKLSQGFFVSLSTLETTFLASPLVKQVYVDGDSLWSYVLAVVVPTGPCEGQESAAALKREIRADMQRLAALKGLQAYEVPRDFILEPTPFSQQNGLLTSSHKLAYGGLKAHYTPALHTLHRQIEDNRRHAIDSALEAPSHAPGNLRDSLVALVSSIAGVEADGGSCLAALGLDSLGLLELSLRVERRWGVKLGVWSDLQAKLTVEALAALIEQRRQGRSAPRASCCAPAFLSCLPTRRSERQEGEEEEEMKAEERPELPAELTGASAIRRGCLYIANPKPTATQRLVCVTWAGGDARLFNAWDLEDIEVVSIDLPAERFDPSSPLFRAGIPELAVLIIKDLATYGYLEPGAPAVSLLGLSFGGVVVFELARQLESESVAVKHLFAISSNLLEPGLARSCVSLIPRVSVMTGLEMLGDAPWTHLLSPGRLASRWKEAHWTRQDMQRLARYTPAPGAVLRAPITSIHGSRDWLTPPRRSKGWLGHSSAGVTYHSIPGAGHLDLAYRAPALRQIHALIRKSLQAND